ncbi:MAG: patatin family protein [Erysipelotrichia bacterium]|nr:patatin family protein [Erysipelotrichia bacterium]NCC54959.1 patatin family protein [Erysipelotrichia bacterium]
MKVSLVLEGGGMRGLYTCGVLDFFLEKQIAFSMVVGVSAGACSACSYLSKQYGRGAAINIDYIKDKRFFSVRNLLKEGSVFGLDFIFNEIPNHLNPYDYQAFHTNPTIFYSVATNIETGEAHYKRIIDMRVDSEYIKASMSLPLISPVVEIDGLKLLDGGISDSIPIQFAMNKGYDKQVVVLTQCRSYRKGKNNLMPIIAHNYKNYPHLVNALANRHLRYNQTLTQLYQLEKEKKAFIIQPQKPVNVSRVETNKSKLVDLYKDGYEDAKAMYEQLVNFLND